MKKSHKLILTIVATIFTYNVLAKSVGAKKAEDKAKEVLKVEDGGFLDFFGL